MRVAFVNPQGNFDPRNSYLASHPDFGGQLVYVREVARVLGEMGHQADILTRRINDPNGPSSPRRPTPTRDRTTSASCASPAAPTGSCPRGALALPRRVGGVRGQALQGRGPLA
jgi:hypothetical protein